MFFFPLFYWDSLHEGSTATTTHGIIRKRSTKRLKHIGKLFRMNLKVSDNSRLRAMRIINQTEARYRARMSRTFDSREDSQPTKFIQSPRIL